MKRWGILSICIFILLAVSIIFTLIGCDMQLGLKSKIQKEFDSNPFLKEENIKLTVLKEENGYVSVAAEMDENNPRKYNVVQEAIDAAKKIKGVKAISLVNSTKDITGQQTEMTGRVLAPWFKKDEKEKPRVARQQIELMGTALDTYKLDVGNYPESLNLLIETGQKKISKWDGPYLAKKVIPKDPWGNDFVYKYPGENAEYDLSSYGKDGKAGGEGLNRDINSWEVDE